MKIKRSVTFFLQKVYKKGEDNVADERQIRMRVKWNGNLVQFNCGYKASPRIWDSSCTRCRRNTSNNYGFSASVINKELFRLESIADDLFTAFELSGASPSVDEFRNSFNEACGRTQQHNDGRDKDGYESLSNCFRIYISSVSVKRSLADGTCAHYLSCMNTLLRFMPEDSMRVLDSDSIEIPINAIINSGIKATTIQSYLRAISTFLKWSYKNGYLKSDKFMDVLGCIKMKKTSDDDIIFLTWDELMSVYNLDLKDDKKRHMRDLFCFECFTSLRISDVLALTWNNVYEDKIKVTQKKTGKVVFIQLNKYSKEILERRKAAGSERPFCKFYNGAINVLIREIAYLAGITKPITRTYYVGSRKVSETREKCFWLSSHAGRRTFISNALMMGIPVTTVMSWSGHSNYESMKPYIKIAESEKETQMNKFNER